MARTDTLGHFLTDVADAIREKSGTSEAIQASSFDTAIANIPSGGDASEYFNLTLTAGSSNANGITHSITSIPSNFTVPSGTTSLAYLFANCDNLTNVPLFNTSNVTNMNNMFYLCMHLQSIPLLDTSNVTNMQAMFSSCIRLLSVPSLNTSNVTNMQTMFIACNRLTTVPQFDMSSVTNITNMFSSCNALTNDSLNNILASCISATSYTGTKTLKQMGLTSQQATACTSLSNYNDFVSAGWSTGY